MIYDANGQPIPTGDSGLFEINSVVLEPNIYYPCDDGTYACNPFVNSGSLATSDRIFISIGFYDENKGLLWSGRTLSHYIYKLDGLKVYSEPYSVSKFNESISWGDGLRITNLVATMDEKPSFVKVSFGGDAQASYSDLKVSYNTVSTAPINNALSFVKFDENNKIGYQRQIGKLAEANTTEAFDGRDAYIRRVRAEAVKMMNDKLHAFRIGSYNVKGSGGFNQYNWYKLKECVEYYGINICGMQEVFFPLKGTPVNDNKTFAEYFESWQFPYVSDNGDAYRKGDGEQYEGKNERMLLSAYPIDSTVEEIYQSAQAIPAGDYRYYAKSVVSLPRYRDKRGSENLKLSVYNTQLEVLGTETAQTQARELLAIAQADPNPFVIIMGDMNDFSLNKEVYKIFKDGGFTPVTDTNTSTVSGTYDYNSIDNFFLSSRIKALDWNVVWSQEWFWSGTYAPTDDYGLSDHDLVYADVQLDYSDIRCINFHLTGATATVSNGKTWMTDEETVTITLTADAGKTLAAVEALDCMLNNTEAITVSGNTITIDGSKLIGDVLITATAT